MVGVKLLEYLDKAGRTGVVDTAGFGLPFNFVDAAFGIEHIDYFAAVRIHHYQFAGLVHVAALHTAADKQAAIGSVQRDCMRRRRASDCEAILRICEVVAATWLVFPMRTYSLWA